MEPNTSPKTGTSNSSAFSQMLEDHTKLTQALIKAQEKEYVLLILEAELRTQRLIHGLEQAGMIVDAFYPRLQPVILAMVGFSYSQVQDDSLVKFYHEQLQKCIEVPLEEFFECVPEMAIEIFGALKQKLG